MSGWRLLWEIMLIGGLTAFAIMAVAVTIGGVRDIRNLLRRIQEQHDRDRSGPGDPPD